MEFLTVKDFSCAEFTEKKSRFIGYIKPVSTKEQAEDFIAEIKAKHYDATHNVPAYILNENNTQRYSDDGEPQGTAGIPVLDILKKESVTNVCVVVTRYFGGIMLGAGGLVRAYSKGCKIALDSAERILMCECQHLQIGFDYSMYGKISYLLPDFDVKIIKSDFSDQVTIELLVRLPLLEKLKQKIIEATNAKISIEILDTVFSEFQYKNR